MTAPAGVAASAVVSANTISNTPPPTRTTAAASSSSAACATGIKVRKLQPSEIEYKDMRFLITDRPTDITMDAYIEELKKHKVKDVVRVCEPSYSTTRLQQEGIRVLDWQFDDGSPPPDDIVDQWFKLLRARFTEDPGCCVAVHCVAGLGRAPVLVALALIERGLGNEDAAELVRQKRRGAINSKQLEYLKKFRPRSRLRPKGDHKSCVMA